MGKEKVCENCKWFKPNSSYSDKIKCINLDRENWKPIEPSNTCKDFILPEDYEPDEFWKGVAELVEEVGKVIK